MTPVTGAGRLLERERELAAISAAVDATAGSAAPGLVIVEGPAGIGKSRLLAEARRRAAERGLRTLTARGGEHERDFPFGVVRQLFEARLAQAADREALLAGAASTAASIFGSSPADGDGSSDVSYGALNGLFWLTLNLGTEQPLVLSIDDLHWCDRASLRYLAYLARRLEGVPILILASLRPAEPGADAALLAELTNDQQATVLTPVALSTVAAVEVVRERLGDDVDPAFAEACHSSTGGNPLLLSELLKAIVTDEIAPTASNVPIIAELGPRAASRAVLLRLARLPEVAVRVARAIAVLGDGADLGVVAALESLSAEEVAVATRELVRVEILRPDPPVGFVHPLVEGAVYRDLSPGERDLHHERAARLLTDLGAPVEQIAAHLLVTPPRGETWVVEALCSAAASALAKGAPDAATSSLERALVEPPPPDERARLILELGRAQVLTSLPDAAARLRTAYETLEEPALRAAAAEGMARTLLFMETPEEAAVTARRAALEVPAGLEDMGRRLDAIEHVAIFFGADHQPDRLERLRANRGLTAPRTVGERMLAAVAAWEWGEQAGPADEVTALARAALGDGVLLEADGGLLAVVATILLGLADLDEAVDTWHVLRANAHRTGSVFAISGVQLWGGYTQLLRGELAEAESELRQSLETLSLWGIPSQSQWTVAFLVELLAERGRLAEARALMDSASYPPDGSDQAILLDRAQMTLLLAEGRTEDALVHADVYAARAGWKCHPRYIPWRSLKALALDRAGRTDEALELASEELELARRWGSPGTVGRSLRIVGVLQREDGIATLEEACATLATAPARLEQAKALAGLGGALRRFRKPTEAREPLQRALELAEVAGAAALVDHVRAEIHATGARPRTTAFRGVGALTASERRVADLAASGQSNRDIAQSLFVTPKTVEVHLTSAYRKLGIRSRRDLMGALATG